LVQLARRELQYHQHQRDQRDRYPTLHQRGGEGQLQAAFQPRRMGSQVGGDHHFAVAGAERMQDAIAEAEQHQRQPGLLRRGLHLLQQPRHLLMQRFLPYHALHQQLRPIVPRQQRGGRQRQRERQQRPQTEGPVASARRRW